MKPGASDVIVVSVSGGRTSALMAKLVKERYGATHRLIFIFANTGKEPREAIVFLRLCNEAFGLDLVLVEAVVHPEMRVGTTHAVRAFDTLAMDGSPYEAVIRKYGIPNKNFPHCTRELKSRPIRSYLRSIGLEPAQYVTAIGYRADEPRRLKWEAAKKARHYFPLAETWRVRKWDVNNHWKQEPFDLGLQEHEGNCDLCWKKSTNKLLTLIADKPSVADWWDAMETTYGHTAIPSHVGVPGGVTFFRDELSARDLIAASRQPFKRFAPGSDSLGMFTVLDDLDDGCAESCEPFRDDSEAA